MFEAMGAASACRCSMSGNGNSSFESRHRPLSAPGPVPSCTRLSSHQSTARMPSQRVAEGHRSTYGGLYELCFPRTLLASNAFSERDSKRPACFNEKGSGIMPAIRPAYQ